MLIQNLTTARPGAQPWEIEFARKMAVHFRAIEGTGTPEDVAEYEADKARWAAEREHARAQLEAFEAFSVEITEAITSSLALTRVSQLHADRAARLLAQVDCILNAKGNKYLRLVSFREYCEGDGIPYRTARRLAAEHDHPERAAQRRTAQAARNAGRARVAIAA